MVEQDGGGGGGGGYNAWPPVGAPLLNLQREEHLKPFDSSVNAVSFGFVATAILISMFLIMAIFERFVRPSSARGHGGDLESQMGFNGKFGHPAPNMTVYGNGVSVLMPGDNVPSFIALPAPVPLPWESVTEPHQQHTTLCQNLTTTPETVSSSISNQLN